MAKILVVDDRAQNRELLVTLLSYKQHQLLEAGDGAQALALVRAERPDLVITDVLMPAMDGYEFMRQLRADPALADTVVIFYTAHYREREAHDLAQSCGVAHFLTKPCEPELVLSTVEQALGVAPVAGASVPDSVFDREHLLLLTNKLSEKNAELQGANQRLAELIEINLQLAAENDTYRLLQKVCGSARSLTGARYAAVGIGDREEGELPDYFITSGMDADTAHELVVPALRQGFLGTLLKEGRARRLSELHGDPQLVGLPKQHPPIHSFLGAPIVSLEHTYGWLCLSDKLGGEGFSEEDENLMSILAAQVGRIYENRSLQADTERHARALEREVAERKQVELQLRELNQELDRRVARRTADLEAANKELEAFSYSVSHDLRAPLRAIDGFASILVEDYPTQLEPEAQSCLRKIQDSAKRMGLLIDALLSFARLGRQPLHKQHIDPSPIVHAVLVELRQSHANREIELRVKPLPDCNADPDLLRQVWTNLLSNAFKFTRHRTAPVIEVGAMRQEREWIFYVRDNGAGFDMRYASKLFGVFQRLHGAGEFEGTGVGLSLVQRIVHRHGGRVWAEAETEKGATFYFTLPD